MYDFLMKYWGEALFMLITSVAVAAYRKLSRKITDKSKEQDAIKLGIQALLRDRIIQSYNHYMERGYCPIYAMENVNALYVQYHALGGNGTITELMEKLKELPTEIKKGEWA
jgi:cell division protein FtsL